MSICILCPLEHLLPYGSNPEVKHGMGCSVRLELDGATYMGGAFVELHESWIRMAEQVQFVE